MSAKHWAMLACMDATTWRSFKELLQRCKENPQEWTLRAFQFPPGRAEALVLLHFLHRRGLVNYRRRDHDRAVGEWAVSDKGLALFEPLYERGAPTCP